MPKVSIEQLENIVLEGGGAKGAAYAGAIQGLEEVFAEYYANHPGDCLPNASAILDYGTGIEDDFEPQIKRFAGSSAGAITSFALALGLNAEQVIEVSNFPFSNFLQETHPGKYRMVGADQESKIGEDARKSLCLDEKAEKYVYSLTKRQKVKADFIKKNGRKYILKLAVSAIIAGVWEKARALFYKIRDLGSGKQPLVLAGLPINATSLLGYWLTLVANSIVGGATGTNPTNPPAPNLSNPTAFEEVKQDKTYFEKLALKYVPKWAIKYLFHKASKSSGMKIGWDAIGNAIFDRGMFSGFAVREFFFDVILYASINNTHFHRSYFSELEQEQLKKVQMNMKDGRLKADFSGLSAGLKNKLEGLGGLTFKEFNEKTGISLTLCVSNFSADEPVYFSEYWTPDFPVLEAVGASMTIPPAMKPVYNAANAFVGPYNDDFYELKGSDVGKKGGGKGAYFDWAKYELDAVAIKNWLNDHSSVKIDSNNNFSISSFIPLLRVALEKLKDQQGFRDPINVEGQDVYITYDLLVYHFNAAYKGLLLDGGYRCNIPYNIFRTAVSGPEDTVLQIDPLLEHTMAIKLDNTYPREWINAIYNKLIQLGELDSRILTFDKKRKKAVGKLMRLQLQIALAQVQSKDNPDFLAPEDLKKFNDECYERIAMDILDMQEKTTTANKVPWNRKKSLFATAFEGYAYGSESGQVRFLSDHENILPLYSYGLGTYDFDLGSIEGLVSLSQTKSKERVVEYFK